MRLLGFDITRTQKSAVAPIRATDAGWSSLIREPFAGAWQRNISQRPCDLLTHSAVYACVSLIASDIAKLRLKLVEQDDDRIWSETDSASFSPVLRKPNRYQTRIKFIEQWIVSKLVHGNAYILKERDARGVVTDLYVLDPTRTRPLVAPDGSVYYQVGQDNLAGITSAQTVFPAREIIHDIMVALYHPLCGVSPITACALSASQGIRIQEHSERFFANSANPGGTITAPAHIPQETADRIKKEWEARYSGANVGRVAVLGDGLTYASMDPVNAVDAQLIEQLKWTGENVCTTFHVPSYMIGIGAPPIQNNIQALNQQYYSQCLQSLIEALELCLDEGLELPRSPRVLGTEVDLDGLLRMDTATQVKAATEGVIGGIFGPNEMRRKFDLKSVPGGDTPYLQQQNFSLLALSKRDAKDDPFGTAKPPAPPADVPTLPAPAKAVSEDTRGLFASYLEKELDLAA